MSSIKELARLMKELEDQLVVCMRCGLCQAVCPLFAETGREADVARGKLALLDGLAQEILKNPQGVQDHLNRCLLCGSCAANCPSGVKVLDIFLKARAILAGYMGLSPWKKIIFRSFLSKPDWFNRVLAWGARFQGIFIKPVDDLLGSSCSRFMSPLLADRHFKPLAPVPWHQQVRELDTPAGAANLTVAFFVGCLIDKIFPQVGEAVLAVLEHHGVGVHLPAGQGCCGIPALSSGDTRTFRDLVRHNLKLLDDPAHPCDYLITACATCSSTIRKLWPLMMQEAGPAEQERIAALAARTLDISQFLVDKVGVTPASAAAGEEGRITVTYHDPCHLKKSLGVAVQPRILLKANPQYVLKEMAESDWCCGCGGSFNLQHYETSAAIGKRKMKNIARSHCQVVATGCPACMLHITDMLSQAKMRVMVKHAVEIYAEALTRTARPGWEGGSPHDRQLGGRE
jgi:glycolate oxidase iron-sulfur subunit|uniref:Glycolate oxidase iron-sulfur subunit n=1 Tax=Desulfobacca acetoxidans TaxID=60893 RepID=A0A7V6A5X3_9BACT